MMTVGVLSFSDGRDRVHESLLPYISECADHIKQALEKTGQVQVVNDPEVIHDADLARTRAKVMLSQDIDALILNVPVFAFPNFSAIAASFQNVPCLAIAPVNGKLPGLGGLQAAVNLITQAGGYCRKIWGNIDQEETLNKVLRFLRAAHAVNRLKGQVYGLFGGRSIGMGSGAVNPDLWFNLFGVDVEHIDQYEIVRRAEQIEDSLVDKAFEWLKQKMGSIAFDGNKLTEESLKTQIRSYYATKELITERKLDFVGVKCHYELSEYYVTQCLAAALFNDPYDWDGPKEPCVYSCEADADGALTMQILKLISGRPVLFFDFRHYDEAQNLFIFCNCGAMSTWYAGRNADPEANLKNVKLQPVIPKYAGQGCHVQYIAKEGLMTFARLTRVLNQYKLTVFKGTFKELPEEKLNETCPAWPHGYVKVDIDSDFLLDNYDNNHVHGVYGDCVDELRQFCALKGIEFKYIG